MRLVLFLVWFLFISPVFLPAETYFRTDAVYDGDTIRVNGLGCVLTVRLAGIDAPETGKNGVRGQPFSQKSRQFLYHLVNQHELVLKNYGTEGYNRQLAEIFIDGKNINLEMIEQGLAEVYQGHHPNGFNPEPYVQAQKRAQKANKGIWSLKEKYQSPGQWRKKHPPFPVK